MNWRRSRAARSNDDPAAAGVRLKSALFVAALVRRAQVEGAYALVRRRGAEGAGAIFVQVDRLDGTSDLYGPAAQSMVEEDGERAFRPLLTTLPAANINIESRLQREMKFDTDLWIVVIEDRQGRAFLDHIVE